ncbi:hypothetical protein EYZ11_004511 [Aspergillus tanneri]|uniref:O-methylsterigmatocystin oxidoreductase n=1 Tax=Aspergillus tanneri TaxID=1220188 RepID=A0A4S3JKP6_9EURO|nr:hypothetical protein EYZ11_004511 [Aspergillus tanneri]
MIAKFILALVVLCLFKWLLTRSRQPPAPLPPGPRPMPIIGNINDLPPHNCQDWMHWYKHKALYGPISSLTVFGQTLVILNEARLANELLEKRSAVHSSRPRMQFAKMAGWENFISVQQYTDPRFRLTRKVLQQQIGSNASVSRFDNIQDVESRRFLLRVCNSPGDLIRHIRKEAGAIILKITYGYTVEPHSRDPLVDLADKAMAEFAESIPSGTWMVDLVPIPRAYKETVTEMSSKPYLFVKQQMLQHGAQPSVLSSLLSDSLVQAGSEEENVMKWSTAAMYAGGADTTVSTITSFFLAMMLYPEAQKRAQAEIDSIVGTDRLPDYEDRDNLPYVNALVKELLRWHPVAPMAAAHMSIQDDIVSRSFTHDPAVYPEPSVFKPERFIESPEHPAEPDPRYLSFGFGRRVCPGRNLAVSNVFLTVARCLAVFDVTHVVRDGKKVSIEPNFSPGAISHPMPFEVSIKPRSEEHERIIRSVEKEHPWEKSQAEELRNLQS